MAKIGVPKKLDFCEMNPETKFRILLLLIYKFPLFYSLSVAIEGRPWNPPSCAVPAHSPEWEEALPKMAAAYLCLPVSSVMT
jgi:hypothetical protein